MNKLTTGRHAHLDEVYPLLDFMPTQGDGVYLQDAKGRRILDMYGGHAVAALGYGHPRLVAAVQEQTRKLMFQSNAVRLKVRDEAAQKLADIAPQGLERVFFVNSGAEANENALRLAIGATGRGKVVAIEHGFHGRTAAAAAVSWGSSKSWYGFPRTPMDVTFVARDDVAALRAAVDAQTAAVILEPVQGLAGAYGLSAEFVQAAREACTQSGALLILDEVQTGMGRLGEPFGAQLLNVLPDILTTAKGLAGGLPAGAVIMRQELARELKPGALGTTFGGGPVACAAICVVVDAIVNDDLPANVRALSQLIRTTCRRGPVLGFQGAGFLLGLKTSVRAAVVRDALLERDILTGTSSDPHVLRLLPPLILESEHVERLAAALGDLENATL
jgi:acetylornithine/succinyldiaminopimelate/putrescine aminotransferase